MQVKYTSLTLFIDLQRKLLDSNEGDDECLFFFSVLSAELQRRPVTESGCKDRSFPKCLTVLSVSSRSE